MSMALWKEAARAAREGRIAAWQRREMTSLQRWQQLLACLARASPSLSASPAAAVDGIPLLLTASPPEAVEKRGVTLVKKTLAVAGVW
jgi:hypothetical protein